MKTDLNSLKRELLRLTDVNQLKKELGRIAAEVKSIDVSGALGKAQTLRLERLEKSVRELVADLHELQKDWQKEVDTRVEHIVRVVRKKAVAAAKAGEETVRSTTRRAVSRFRREAPSARATATSAKRAKPAASAKAKSPGLKKAVKTANKPARKAAGPTSRKTSRKR